MYKYILFLLTTFVFAQPKYTVQGNFNSIANQEITLTGFNVQKPQELYKGKVDKNGNFSLEYPTNYVGAAILEITTGKSLIVLLNHENFEIQWDDLNTMKSLKFINSIENALFDTGLLLYQNTEAKKVGITYLIPYYANDIQKQQFFQNELKEQNMATTIFFNNIEESRYAKYYLKIRMLIANMTQIANSNLELLPQLEKEFNEVDFADQRLIHSGLYNQLLEAFVVTMENYGEKQYLHLNNSIDFVLESLNSNLNLKQDIAAYLFNLLEKRSLFAASEYLALKMLSQDDCQLDQKHEALFEQYRKMAIGNVVPNIKFENSNKPYKELSNLKSTYKLIVFGASWCQKCSDEIPKLKTFYKEWKEKYDLEIVFISLDTQRVDHQNFTKEFPWTSSCDFNGWETKPAYDYSIFSTPTMYLIDNKNKILLKPIAPEQINAWLGYK